MCNVYVTAGVLGSIEGKTFRPIYVYIAGNLSLAESNRPPPQQIPSHVARARALEASEVAFQTSDQTSNQQGKEERDR